MLARGVPAYVPAPQPRGRSEYNRLEDRPIPIPIPIPILVQSLSSAAVLVTGQSPSGPGAALAFAAITGLGMFAGVWAFRRFEPWAHLHTGELIAFAAGLLISGALLHLMDRSMELIGSGSALAWTLTGFLALYVVEAHFIPHVHARGEHQIEDQAHGGAHLGPLVVAGLAVHSVADGVTVGAGLSAGALIGSVALSLVVVHKVPVGIAAISALYHSGVTGRTAVWICAALSMVTPVAVLVSYFVFRDVTSQVLGILLALASGSFLYVGAADLLPEGQATGKPVNTVMFFFGILGMVGLKLWAQ